MRKYSRDLAQNPCHMCMPMGGILALKGVEGTMSLLHGSQGCSTYMRRHIAEHFNEPVDVASSSLNEKGTVYGGQANLKQGLDNVRRVYGPKLIGILTTCLAETIGEDIRRMAGEYRRETTCECDIVTSATPGYGGTHTEGYWSTLRELVAQLSGPVERHTGINLIVPAAFSPADLREMKRWLELMGVEYTLLPDISETMDRPYEPAYSKIAEGGTPLAKIKRMAGAAATLELGGPVEEKLSPGIWLQKEFGVPCRVLRLPIGLGNTDNFFRAVSGATGKAVSAGLLRERGLLMDAMIDAHKPAFSIRPALFGDPEMVQALSGFCIENGMFPRVVATGGGSTAWRRETKAVLAEGLEPALVLEETDMAVLLQKCLTARVNLAVGPSVGRYLEEKAEIPLVRIGFPIQDRQGERSASYLQAISVRPYCWTGWSMPGWNASTKLTAMICIRRIIKKRRHPAMAYSETELAATKHPCYSPRSQHTHARMHLPVAPFCNIQCNYCNRLYDCVNESRPGVTSEVLTPEQALAKIGAVREKIPNLAVIGIAGPGDALANWPATRATLAGLREQYPDLIPCLSTNGLLLPRYAAELVELGVKHVTVTVNSVDTAIGEDIYRYLDWEGKRLYGRAAAGFLLEQQLTGIHLLADYDVLVKVNIVAIPGLNEFHIPAVVKIVKGAGASLTNIMPLIPAAGSNFAHLPQPSHHKINKIA